MPQNQTKLLSSNFLLESKEGEACNWKHASEMQRWRIERKWQIRYPKTFIIRLFNDTVSTEHVLYYRMRWKDDNL
jgi:hypothetical protein